MKGFQAKITKIIFFLLAKIKYIHFIHLRISVKY